MVTGNFVVMVNYGLEGWKIADQADFLLEALKIREREMSLGNAEVVIFKTVNLDTMFAKLEEYGKDEI
jgi:hypothetical protein